ncbi:hypothetical protein Y032_0004g1938 [Ancylostoma ceylanicum]|uniref:Secreted protein n=1 Tax=Ancylostoma ceylanicum TaxID=53326 RepID=A0A016VVP0_9BILA|nr:hypothetical protein Y032_0004g1938 [Ancylostoma ceylanicum]
MEHLWTTLISYSFPLLLLIAILRTSASIERRIQDCLFQFFDRSLLVVCTQNRLPYPTRQAVEMDITSKRRRGAPKKRCKDAIRKDTEEAGVTKDNTQDRALCRGRTNTMDPATVRDKR